MGINIDMTLEDKEEALKLADQLEDEAKFGECDWTNPRVSADMIRRLVEELDKAYSDGEVCGGCGAIRYDPICEKPQTKPLSDEEILQAVARGWCSDKNSHKTMDSDLATAIADEIKKAILERHGIK